MFSVPTDHGGWRYSTFAPGTQNPVTINGPWLQGLTDGVDWSDVQMTGGAAYGTQVAPVGPPYNDSTLITTGSWPRDHEVTNTILVANQPSGAIFEESAIRLRSLLSANVSTGYEIGFRNRSDGSQYCGITRFNGPVNSYTTLKDLASGAAGAPPITDGCQVRARIVGSVITYWHRATVNAAWTQVDTYDTASDNLIFGAGRPGLMFWNRDGVNTDIGVTAFQAVGL